MRLDKVNPISLLQIMREYSDENYILAMHDILEKFRNLYGCKTDRRTIYHNLELLQSCGFDTSTYGENHVGYYLREREFEGAELRLLMDAVYRFSFLSPEQSEKLVKKLQQFSAQANLYLEVPNEAE